jgi:glutamyl-tRNA reductase
MAAQSSEPGASGMHIVCVGLNFRTAPLTVRERVNMTPTDLAPQLARFAADASQQLGPTTELVILSTCNRLEFYAAAGGMPANRLSLALRQWLVSAHGRLALELDRCLYEFSDVDAARHLSRVAAGLDSQVLGETQIQGQVSTAYRVATDCGTVGAVLARLFVTALAAGKRARTETAISQHATSLSTLAIQAAAHVIPDLSTANVLVIGAGEMAGLALQALRRQQVHAVTVTNRTLARAQALAAELNINSIGFEEVAKALAEADLVIAATSAPEGVITAAQVSAAMQARPDRRLVLVDLAVPRNIAPEAGGLANVRYFDLDALDAQRLTSLEARQAAVQPVETIIESEVQRFSQWLEEWAVRDVIVGLHAKADVIRQDEVERTLRRLPHLSDAERQHVEALAKSLFNRLLHEPTARLMAQSGSQAAAYSAAVRDLFGLDEAAQADG